MRAKGRKEIREEGTALICGRHLVCRWENGEGAAD